MPELPEVETVVRGLKGNIIGKKINTVKVFKERMLVNASPGDLQSFCYNEKITDVKRFGKYIHFILTSKKSMVAHLRMTGKFVYVDGSKINSDDDKFVRIVFLFSDSTSLLFHDVRTFGTIKIYQEYDTIDEKQKTGIDALADDLTGQKLMEIFKRKKANVKSVLLNQQLISGLGNIYVCELLFAAAVDPQKAASLININEAELILKNMREILKTAIKLNGTTISDFRMVDDKTGSFQEMLKVYQKEGVSCPRCKKGIITRIKQNQRSTFYCPNCQM